MTRLRAMVIVMVALAGNPLAVTTASAQTAQPGSFLLLSLAGNDAIYNYDFRSQNAQANNIDWPTTMFFRGNANINKLKNFLMPHGFQNAGNIMNYRLRDNANFVWDTDRGTKNPNGACPVNIHMRLYADADDSMWNPVDNWYVLGTTHWDQFENCAGEWFGASEIASDGFGNMYGGVIGWAIGPDAIGLGNFEPDEWQGNSFMQNDGWAHSVAVP